MALAVWTSCFLSSQGFQNQSGGIQNPGACPSRNSFLPGVFVCFQTTESEKRPLALGRRKSTDEGGGKDDGVGNIGEGKQKKPQEVNKKGDLSAAPGATPLTETTKGKPE